jgi:hypothetical protein
MYFIAFIVGLGFFVCYIVAIVIIDVLLRGFAPFLPARPWVVEKILKESAISKDEHHTVYSLACGKSGLLREIEKNYPYATVIGVEHEFYPWLIAKIQQAIRRTRIRIIRKDFYKLDVRDATLVYCYLNVEEARELGKKFKYECQVGTKIICNGTPLQSLSIKQAFNLDPRPGRLKLLSKSRNFYIPKSKMYNYQNRVFIYEID